MTAIDYTDVPTVKAHLGISDSDEDALIGQAIRAASRAIDQMCGTTFYPVTETRTFTAWSAHGVLVDRFTDPEGLVVKTGHDGTFGTTLTAGQYILGPAGAPARGYAYWELAAPGGLFVTGSYWPGVQVTARWGWHYVPEQVRDYATHDAVRRFKLKDAPFGVAGTPEYGEMRADTAWSQARADLAPFMDPGVA